MPIEIRELVIKATITDDAAAGSSGAGKSGSGDNNNVSPGEEMIKDTLDKIMDAIKDRNER
ncbi:DUF5908 family protein [Chitinophaga silvisoli]|uniref:Uncharacterized protein n=1 Tax=Chitinophaga silvisoli TaxID=2291814 RepID=A0A3E1NWC3_9BACT|nr:DUF5908 family protein [Chitinophaga silvisoli]RFM32223.1 hypothetical protein DXN04_25950 [Chitinophaga silvisoli]